MAQSCEATGERPADLAGANNANLHCSRSFSSHAGSVVGMAGRYTGSYLDRPNGWRAVANLAEIGRASLVERIPKGSIRTLPGRRQQGSVLINRGRKS
jgi:hypothetical protein